MTDQYAPRRAPLVLLVNHQEWTARSVESVLRPAGYAVVKAYTGRQAIELALRLRPDLVIVDYKLSDTLGLDACRAIRQLPTVDGATPFIIATAAHLSRRERRECFRAGIWEILSSPFDPIELVGKLEAFLTARRQAEEAWEYTHRDAATGLYNWKGLLARAEELIADAQRNTRWTACVALGPKKGQTIVASSGSVADSSDGVLELLRSDTESPKLLDRITAAFARETRDADATAILGADDLLVLAPGTDEAGAEILAKRLVVALNDPVVLRERPPSELEFSAGYYSALDETGGSLMAQDLLGRTMEALRTAQHADAGSMAVLPFHPA
jgi:CheY-like chemotaxis protein